MHILGDKGCIDNLLSEVTATSSLFLCLNLCLSEGEGRGEPLPQFGLSLYPSQKGESLRVYEWVIV